MTCQDTRYAEEIRARTQDRVDLIGLAGDRWRFAASLKSVIEDVAQEYAGRAVLELIQNGHDAIERGSSGRIHVLLDLDGQHPALYVANDGRPFGTANFDGIIDLGLSPKGAGEGIGNKGLGFRSVLLLTDCPEIYSRDPENRQDQSFSGYSFRFPAVSELAGLADDPALGERLTAEASPLNLPVPMTADDPQVLRFARDGFATVIKLALRDDVAVAEARQQIDSLAGGEAADPAIPGPDLGSGVLGALGFGSEPARPAQPVAGSCVAAPGCTQLDDRASTSVTRDVTCSRTAASITKRSCSRSGRASMPVSSMTAGCNGTARKRSQSPFRWISSPAST